MLEDAHEELRRGRDVVIGYLETHGRAETLAMAAGMEQVPRRRVLYRETTLEELDMPAVVSRHPGLCLIDELAHTNVHGLEHDKRHEDVAALLAAGIDVYSTVNVQHVESLAVRIAAATGIEVREMVPDRVLHDADDVVLVAVTPALLLERLRDGKIYSDQSAAVAEAGFFRPDRLAALREMSLLEVAEQVEPGRREGAQPPAGGLERLVSALGGTLLIEEGEDLVTIAARVAHERGTTYVVMGRPRRKASLGQLVHRRLPLQLMDALPRVDLQIVALPESFRAEPDDGR